jgi:DNA-nicking Smr family endonuclease
LSAGRNPFEPLDGPVADTLDLHGMTATEAEPAVRAFLQRCRRRTPGGLVHIITGRGRGSPGRPVLKSRVKTMLKAGGLPAAAWGEDLNGGGYLVRLP